MSIEMTGLADIVRQHASQRPDTAAIVHAGRTTTYAELNRASNQVANGLVAEGIEPQARVAHLDKSSDIFFELLFGAAKANAVMISVNWRLAPPEVLHILNDAQAEILFVGEEYFPVVEKIRDELKMVRKIVAFGGRHGAWMSFAEWRDRQSAADPHLPVRSDDTAVQFYTSGTTGLPKGAVREFIPAEILQIIERERLQVMLLVPAMILFLVQAPQIRETDLSSLRLIVYGAAPIPAELLKQAMGIFPCGFQRRRRQGPADRRGRRDRRALTADHAGLLAPARGHPERDPGRLVPDRRRGLPRR
jgi:acyl-CoA synthetase (AMP-forming)/AMP-acid ligase II